MDDHDLELEKARLISLAHDFGFDEESAKKCLDRMVQLYGIYPFLHPPKKKPTNFKTPFSINVCTLCDFMCVCVSGLKLRNGFWVFIYFVCLFLVLFFFTNINVCTLSDFMGVCVFFVLKGMGECVSDLKL